MIAPSSRRTSAHPLLGSLCPTTATRPQRSWLVVISSLWLLLWLQFEVVPASWSRLTALTLFSMACCDTVLYGMSLRTARAQGPGPGILSSSAIGVLTLGAVSWIPILVIGAAYCLVSLSIGPIAVLLFFGLPVSLALFIAGYVVILVLLGVGRLLGWAIGGDPGTLTPV